MTVPSEIELRNSLPYFLKSSIISNHYNLIKSHIESGYDINIRCMNGETLLMVAASHCKTSIIELLLESGADVNLRDDQGFTALMISVIHCDLASVSVLVQHGADLNGQDGLSGGITPLMIAACLGRADVVNVLIQHGADTSLVNDRGESALFNAMQESHHELVSLLRN